MPILQQFLRLAIAGNLIGLTACVATVGNTAEIPANEATVIDSLPVVPPGLNNGYSLVTKPSKKVAATYSYRVHTPNLKAREWIFFAAVPPDLPSQSIRRAWTSPKGEVIQELSPLAREIFRVRLLAEEDTLHKSAAIEVTMRATLFSRKLVTDSKSTRSNRNKPLTENQKRLSLRPTARFDYADPLFQSWIDKNDLRRRGNEGEVDFARRIFRFIVGHYQYDYQHKMKRSASHLCQVDKTDCGGMSFLFGSVLRAAGIPARALLGRWASSAVPGKQVNGITYLQQHAKAEFYAQGVGWIPVDLSSCVLHDKSESQLRYFGNDRGDFLTWHIDSDFVYDSIHFGQKTKAIAQRPFYWVIGSGNMKETTFEHSWVVR